MIFIIMGSWCFWYCYWSFEKRGTSPSIAAELHWNLEETRVQQNCPPPYSQFRSTTNITDTTTAALHWPNSTPAGTSTRSENWQYQKSRKYLWNPQCGFSHQGILNECISKYISKLGCREMTIPTYKWIKNFPTCQNNFLTCLINFHTYKWIQKKTSPTNQPTRGPERPFRCLDFLFFWIHL